MPGDGCVFCAVVAGSEPSHVVLDEPGGRRTVHFQEWFSRYSKTGTVGDPTKATREKGEKFVKAVVARMVALLKEFRVREIQARVDHH